MPKKLALVLALAGAGLFWMALITEVSLRYLPDSFLAMAFLSFVGCVSTGYMGYRIQLRQSAAGSDRQRDEQEPKSSGARQPRRRTRSRRRKGDDDVSSRQDDSQKAQSTKKDSSTTAPQGTQKSRRPRQQRKEPPESASKPEDRIEGRIKLYFSKQSYGFVVSENGDEAFFHKNNLVKDFDTKQLRQNLPVSYELESGDRGPVAVRIQERK